MDLYLKKCKENIRKPYQALNKNLDIPNPTRTYIKASLKGEFNLFSMYSFTLITEKPFYLLNRPLIPITGAKKTLFNKRENYFIFKLLYVFLHFIFLNIILLTKSCKISTFIKIIFSKK